MRARRVHVSLLVSGAWPPEGIPGVRQLLTLLAMPGRPVRCGCLRLRRWVRWDEATRRCRSGCSSMMSTPRRAHRDAPSVPSR